LKTYATAYPVRPAKTILKSHGSKAPSGRPIPLQGASLPNVAKCLGQGEGIFAAYPPAWQAGLEETRMIL
jgi:hypothetical protein